MKIKLAILSLLCSTILLNGCATQSIQPDAQSNLLLKPKLADEPEKMTQSEIKSQILRLKITLRIYYVHYLVIL